MARDDLDPQALLQRGRGGDADAVGQVLELYRPYLHVLARTRLGADLQSKTDPSDVVQDAFLAAHRDFGSFRGTTEAELMTWLRHILAARVADVQRRYLGAQRRDVALERQLRADLDQSSQALEQALPGREPSPSQQAVRRERAVLLADALERLPENYREVLLLHHLHGLSFPAVAEQMGRSLDSVKQLWMRALARLRRALGEET